MPEKNEELRDIIQDIVGIEEAMDIQDIVNMSYYLDQFESSSQINNYIVTCR